MIDLEKAGRIMKGKARIILGALTVCTFIAVAATDVHAGTCIYVGKDVSADGTMLLGTSTEYNIGSATVTQIIEKGSIRKGDVIESGNGFKYTMPDDIDKVVLERLMDYVGIGEWVSCASNEHGVSVLSTITTQTCPEAIAADPFESEGISEEKIALIAAATSKTAGDAVRTLCSIYEETGAYSAEIVMIADQKEAWIVENFTGHQYVAIKLPDDKMAVFGNDPVIRTADPDDKDTIMSSDLLTLPEKNGFAVYDDDKKIDLISTYKDDINSDESHLREWVGHNIFAPSEELEYDPDTGFDLFFTPDEKVTVEQAFDLFRNRFEGTAYALDGGDRTHYGINNQYVSSANLIQIFDGVPEALSTVFWTTTANPTAAPFIPVPVAADTLPASISTDYDEDEYAEGTLQFDLAKLNNSVYQRRQLYGKSIREYWKGAETLHADDIRENITGKWSKEELSDASKQIDEYVADIVDKTDENCVRLSDELDWYLFRKGSMSIEIPDEELEPFECSFDAVSFARENGWETTVENDVFTAEKDGKKIEVVLAGENKGAVTFTGFDNEQLMKDFMAEDTEGTVVVEENETEKTEEPAEVEEPEKTEEPEAEAKEPEKVEKPEVEASEEVSKEPAQEVLDIETGVAEKVEVDTIAALEDYFAEKIANIPRDGWAENEIASQINDISVDVAGIVAKYFDVDINSPEDIEKLLNTDISQIQNDPELGQIGDKLIVTGMDLTGLLEKYFTSLVEDANADVASGRLSQEGVEKILLEAKADIEGIAQLYVQGVFGQIFDMNLSEEEFNEALAELGAGALQVMNDYGAIDLESLGLGDINIEDLTDADIEVIITLNEMDDDVIDGLSDLIGVDVRAVIDSYMEALAGAGESLVVENHINPSAWSAPDEKVMAAIEKEEALKGDDEVLSQDVIDTINEAILNGYFEDALDSIEGEEVEKAAPEAESFTIQLPSVKAVDSKVLLPSSMLRYFE